MKKLRNISISITGIVLILIIINLISGRFFFRLDFTADKRYTLSRATRDIVTKLPEKISVTAYYTKDLPPDIAQSRRDFTELLVEYYQLSKGKVLFEMIDPNESPESEQRAQAAGIRPVVANIREKDQVKQQRVYLGAVVNMGESSDVIPFISPGSNIEYALSSSIKKVSVSEKPRIAYLQGHGEPPVASFEQVNTMLSVLYDLVPVTLTDSTDGLTGFNTLVVVSPTDTVPPSHIAQMEKLLQSGGNIYLAINEVNGDFNSLQGTAVNTGFEQWLAGKGVTIEKKFIVDASCANIGVTQQSGGFTFQSQIPFPYFPLLAGFEKHPVTQGLESVVLRFCSPMKISVKPDIIFTPLAKTSAKSAAINPPVMFDINRQWNEADFQSTPLTVAGILSGKGQGGKEWKMIVLTDGQFANNGMGQQAQEAPPDNISFMVNGIDWLSDNSGLMELRSKEVTNRPLDPISDARKQFLKYLNFLLPILLIVGYGLYRLQRNRNSRMRRMQPGIL